MQINNQKKTEVLISFKKGITDAEIKEIAKAQNYLLKIAVQSYDGEKLKDAAEVSLSLVLAFVEHCGDSMEMSLIETSSLLIEIAMIIMNAKRPSQIRQNSQQPQYADVFPLVMRTEASNLMHILYLLQRNAIVSTFNNSDDNTTQP